MSRADKARSIISGMNGQLDRKAVKQWLALRDAAEGQERQVIGGMSEALRLMIRTDEEARWFSALLNGWPDADEKTGRSDRNDKAEQQQPEEGKESAAIDWNLVNREAAIGVELNRKAMTLWKQQQKGEKG